EGLHAREGHDLVELPVDLPLAHPEDGAVQVDVLAPREIAVKAGPDLEQASDPAVQLHAAGRGRRDPGHDLQRRALAGAVASDEAEDLSLLDVEGHVAKRPEIAGRGAGPAD